MSILHMDVPSSPSRDTGQTVGEAQTRSLASSRLVPAFYAALLLGLLGVAAYGDGVHPLLVAALGSGLVVTWLGWPAYRETVDR
jgi:hypothetical protein